MTNSKYTEMERLPCKHDTRSDGQCGAKNAEADLAAERAKWAQLRALVQRDHDAMVMQDGAKTYAGIVLREMDRIALAKQVRDFIDRLDHFDRLASPSDVVRSAPVSIHKVDEDVGYEVTVLVESDDWSLDERLRFAQNDIYLVRVKEVDHE